MSTKTAPETKTAFTEITASEMTETLTGFDEIAIEKHFGIDPYMDGETKPIRLMRALVFVHQRREGKDDKAAKDFAMNMPLSQVSDGYFTEEPEDASAEGPDSESGKDD